MRKKIVILMLCITCMLVGLMSTNSAKASDMNLTATQYGSYWVAGSLVYRISSSETYNNGGYATTETNTAEAIGYIPANVEYDSIYFPTTITCNGTTYRVNSQKIAHKYSISGSSVVVNDSQSTPAYSIYIFGNELKHWFRHDPSIIRIQAFFTDKNNSSTETPSGSWYFCAQNGCLVINPEKGSASTKGTLFDLPDQWSTWTNTNETGTLNISPCWDGVFSYYIYRWPNYTNEYGINADLSWLKKVSYTASIGSNGIDNTFKALNEITTNLQFDFYPGLVGLGEDSRLCSYFIYDDCVWRRTKDAYEFVMATKSKTNKNLSVPSRDVELTMYTAGYAYKNVNTGLRLNENNLPKATRFNILQTIPSGTNTMIIPAEVLKDSSAMVTITDANIDIVVTGTLDTEFYTVKSAHVSSSYSGNNTEKTNKITSTGVATHYISGEKTYKTYKINYEGTAGSVTSYNCGEKTRLVSPTKTGYTFNGWIRLINATTVGSVPSDSEGYFVPKETWSGDITLEATWTPINYTIKYNTNGGNTIADDTYNIETAKTLPTPTKTGYKFKGWKDGTTVITQIPKGTTGNKNLTAEWEPEVYRITLDAGEGTVTELSSYTYGVGVSQLPNATPNDQYMVFDGWYNSQNEKVESISTTSLGDISLTASYKPGTFTITYTGVDGLVNGNPTTYTYKTETTLTDVSKNGYKFDGWYNGTTKVTSLGATGGNVTLEGKFTPNTYKITYEGVTGLNNENPNLYTYDQVLTLKPVEKSGYTFKGWYDASNNKIESVAKGTIGDIVLTAQFEVNTYTITYKDVPNGVTNTNPTTYTYGKAVSLTVTYISGLYF